MKTAAFAISLMLGGAALAQTTTTTTHTDHTGTMSTDVSTQVGTAGVNTDVDMNADTNMPSTDTTVTTQTNTNWNTTTAQSNSSWNTGQTTMASNMTGQVVQPSNANPERDARGIRVISDPAMAPAGYNGSTGTGMGGPVSDTGASMAAEPSPPACSKTVTDNCVQTYERGRAPR